MAGRTVGLILLLLTVPVSAQEATDVRIELERMHESDQSLRFEIRNAQSKSAGKSPALEALWKRQVALDAENIRRLVEIVEASGWPKISEVGEVAAAGAFLVLQHSDVTYQKRLLPLVRAEAALGEVKLSSLALLEDRVLVADGHAQRYGSQIRRDPETGNMEFFPIENEVEVDLRRKSVGLEPIASYARRFGLNYVPVKAAD